MRESPTSSLAETVLAKILSRDVHVGVVGLGYVGLPLALAFVERAGVMVTGFDLDQKKVDLLNRGETYITHLGKDRVRTAISRGRFCATSNFGEIGGPDALMIAVPTPLTAGREPDMTYVARTCETIAEHLRRGQLVILESTTYPGTTDELVRPILDRSGLRCGQDYFLAFSPEREDPGNKQYNVATIPKIVGGVDADSGVVATALYSLALDRVVQVRSSRVAEATKLTENVFRSVNIALVNELKMVYERMGIDVWEVLSAASTKPFGFMRFDPGPGLGGHCIPVDPFYLTWKAREFGVSTRLIELAGDINVSMPQYVLQRLQQGLSDQGKAVKGSRVLLLGIAYKRDIDDPRESPAFELIRLLLEQKAVVVYHDPHIAVAPAMRSWPSLPQMHSQDLTQALLNAQDAVVIATDHSSVDYAFVLQESRLIVDTRGVYKDAQPNVIRA